MPPRRPRRGERMGPPAEILPAYVEECARFGFPGYPPRIKRLWARFSRAREQLRALDAASPERRPNPHAIIRATNWPDWYDPRLIPLLLPIVRIVSLAAARRGAERRAVGGVRDRPGEVRRPVGYYVELRDEPQEIG